MPVVDASVGVSLWHGRDRHHRRCVRWLERALADGAPLVAPTLFPVEVCAAVRRLTGDESLAEAVLSEMEDLRLMEYVALTRQRGLRASEIAAATAVRGADAVYLELARDRGEVLITLDRQQLERGGTIARVRRP